MKKPPVSSPTLKDVAAAAGLSIAAVSKVFNNREGVSAANRALVIKIAEELGYKGISGRVANAGHIQQALVATLDKYVTNDAFYGQIIDALLEQAKAENIAIELAIITQDDIERQDFSLLTSSGPDAIFLVGLDNPPILEHVHAYNHPTVLVNGMDSSMSLSSVSPDNYFGGREVTRRFLDLGHREIVHVTHPYRESFRRRLAGFREALEAEGIEFCAERHVFDVGAPENLSLSCYEKVAAFLKKRDPMPSAIFCANDMVALGVLRAIETLSLKVPDDISVIGFDALSVSAHASPPLSTMQINGYEMACQAVRMLLDMAQSENKTARRMSLGVRYIERASVGSLL